MRKFVTMISAKEPAGNGETPGRLTRISTGPLERQEAPAAVASGERGQDGEAARFHGLFPRPDASRAIKAS